MCEYLCYAVYVTLIEERERKQSDAASPDFWFFWKDVYSQSNVVPVGDFMHSLTESEKLYIHQADEMTTEAFSYFRFSPHIEIARRLYSIRTFQRLPQGTTAVSGYGDKQVSCSLLMDRLPSILRCLLSMQLTEAAIESDLLLLRDCFQALSPHGIQHLLGFRHTVGSVDLLYPPRAFLLECFEKANNPKSKLTVGARALSKHCIRCKAQWGELKGPEAYQNEVARSTVLRILEHCSWLNIHLLPHDITVLEVRVDSGFGCRWDLKDFFFRGFVEPYMENGYEVGWIHNDE